jgi:hypothetical protein
LRRNYFKIESYIKLNLFICVKKSTLINMTKPLFLLAILFCTASGAFAQYYQHTEPSTIKFGVGINSGFAVGPVSGYYPAAGGFSLNLEFPVQKSPVSFLLTTGYTFYVSQGGYGFDFYGSDFGTSTYYYGDVASFIPVQAGVKIYVARQFFIEGYAGVSFNVNAYPSDYTGRASAFIYTPGAGYSIPLGVHGKSKLDIGLVYENRVEPGGGYTQIAARGVWNFSL